MTLVKRREKTYVRRALVLHCGPLSLSAILHVFNNLVVPSSLFKSVPIYAGVQDAMMQWWYGHNAVAFFLTTPFSGFDVLLFAQGRRAPGFLVQAEHYSTSGRSCLSTFWAGPHHLQLHVNRGLGVIRLGWFSR